MGFESGSLSYARYAVVGSSAADMPSEEMLAQLAAHRFTASDVGLPLETEWGWAGPRHMLDRTFDFGNCVFNDCIHFGLRIDTNRVPAEIKRAQLMIEEEAIAKGNPSGFISKQQKRQVKDAIAQRMDEELRTGKHRRSKLIPLLWDVPAGILYGPSSVAAREKLVELFERTFDRELRLLSSGAVALHELELLGQRREYEDFTPTRFAKSPEDPGAPAEYPWTARGDGAKDFLGNEFLLWLWHEAQTKAGSIATAAGDVTVMFDRTLQLDCVFNHTGKESLTAAGPTRMPEAHEGLRTGKVPRKAGLIIDAAGSQFNLTLTGESLAVGSLKLPNVENADTPRTLFEERITLLRDFSKALDAMFNAFLSARTTTWTSTVKTMAAWAGRKVA